MLKKLMMWVEFFFLRNASKPVSTPPIQVSTSVPRVVAILQRFALSLREGNWGIGDYDDVVVDVTVRHDFTGDARDVRRHGTLRNPDRPDQLLCEQKQQRGAGLWDEVCSPNYIRRCSGGLCSLLRICM